MNLQRLFLILVTVAQGSASSSVQAGTELPAVFGNHMVLQRDRPLPVWGWDAPGTEVTVRLGDSSVSTQAGNKGRWKVLLPRQAAGGPVQMKITGSSAIEYSDILIGEVWVCSGQSNMEWPVSRSASAEREMAAAQFKNVRLLHIPRVASALPRQDVSAAWKPCTPETVPAFSAVAYYFGRHLQQELGVPIGLINVSWGGTRIEPWTPPAGFAQVAAVQDIGESVLRRRNQVAAAERTSGKAGHPPPRNPLDSRGAPTALFNGMIQPLVPFGIRGTIWYQGEANRLDGPLYTQKMRALIKGWRTVWGQGDFPFYYVQLAPFIYRGADPAMLPVLWEAQTAVLALRNTGMAVTTDIATVRNIHPPDKQNVGRRLALWALARTYGRNEITYSGPLYRSMTIEGSGIWLEFDHTGTGLQSRDGKPLDWFMIAGESGDFVPAEAVIHGDRVHVSSSRITAPTDVRFGWDQTAEPNLVNRAGLPASPFRTGR